MTGLSIFLESCTAIFYSAEAGCGIKFHVYLFQVLAWNIYSECKTMKLAGGFRRYQTITGLSFLRLRASITRWILRETVHYYWWQACQPIAMDSTWNDKKSSFTGTCFLTQDRQCWCSPCSGGREIYSTRVRMVTIQDNLNDNYFRILNVKHISWIVKFLFKKYCPFQ